MESPFMIIRTFLKDVEFSSPNTPGLFFSNNSTATMGVTIDVQAKVADGTSLFLVDLITRVMPKVEEQVIFDIQLTYSALVELDITLDEDTRKRILQVLVPQNIYNPMRALVWKITNASGFPPFMLNDYDFMSNAVGNASENTVNDIESSDEVDEIEDFCLTDDSDDNNLPLGYNWIIKDIQSTKEGNDFLQTLIQKGRVNISRYEELPLYKYYYRFLKPIKYHRPEIESEDSYWDMLFQLIFAEGENAKVIDGKTEVPEIEINIDGERKFISDLTIEELKSLTSDLAVHAFTHSLVDIVGANIDIGYSTQINENNPVLREELLSLYSCNKPYANTDTVAFVDQIYERIKECDLQTFPYKL